MVNYSIRKRLGESRQELSSAIGWSVTFESGGLLSGECVGHRVYLVELVVEADPVNLVASLDLLLLPRLQQSFLFLFLIL